MGCARHRTASTPVDSLAYRPVVSGRQDMAPTEFPVIRDNPILLSYLVDISWAVINSQAGVMH